MGHDRDMPLFLIGLGARFGGSVRQVVLVDETPIVRALEVRDGDQVNRLPKSRQNEDRHQNPGNEPE